MSKKTDKAISLMKVLEIPCTAIKINPNCSWSDQNCIYDRQSTINVDDLYDILIDEEKLRILVSKLKLKAFW